MRTLIVSLRDGSKVSIQADSFMEIGGRHHFFRDGEAVAFTYFESSEVIGVSEHPTYPDDFVAG